MKRFSFLINKPWLRNLYGAWLFYTIFPALSWPKPQFDRIARFSPFIGLVIGSIQSLVWLVLHQIGWTNQSTTYLAISIGIWATGGLHLDGLMDTADGIGAGPNKFKEAMKDSRVGASAVISIIIILFIQIGSLIKLGKFAPMTFPIACFWGRVASLIAIHKYSYLNENTNPYYHKKHWKGLSEGKPTLICLIFAIGFMSIINIYRVPYLISLLLVCLITSYIVAYCIGEKLGGHTGDSYGACVVITETSIFFLLAILL